MREQARMRACREQSCGRKRKGKKKAKENYPKTLLLLGEMDKEASEKQFPSLWGITRIQKSQAVNSKKRRKGCDRCFLFFV